jgi:hypothetical protein
MLSLLIPFLFTFSIEADLLVLIINIVKTFGDGLRSDDKATAILHYHAHTAFAFSIAPEASQRMFVAFAASQSSPRISVPLLEDFSTETL